MTTTAAPDALLGAVSAVAAEVTGELAAVLARLGELTDAAVAAEATGDLEADALHGCAATRWPDQRVRCRARRVGIPSPRPGPAPSRRRSSGRRAGRLRSASGGDAGPEVRLRGRPAGLRAARAHRPCRPPGRAVPSAGHDGDPVGVPARRAGCGVPGGAAHAHRLGQEHRRSAQPRPDHGGHPGGTDHRTGCRRRRPGRGGDRRPGRRAGAARCREHGRGGRVRPDSRCAGKGRPSRGPGAALVAAAVRRAARWCHRRRPGSTVFRRHTGGVARLPRRRSVSGTVLRRYPPARSTTSFRTGPVGPRHSRTAAPPASGRIRSARCPAGRSASSTTAAASIRSTSSP